MNTMLSQDPHKPLTPNFVKNQIMILHVKLGYNKVFSFLENFFFSYIHFSIESWARMCPTIICDNIRLKICVDDHKMNIWSNFISRKQVHVTLSPTENCHLQKKHVFLLPCEGTPTEHSPTHTTNHLTKWWHN